MEQSTRTIEIRYAEKYSAGVVRGDENVSRSFLGVFHRIEGERERNSPILSEKLLEREKERGSHSTDSRKTSRDKLERGREKKEVNLPVKFESESSSPSLEISSVINNYVNVSLSIAFATCPSV